MKFRQHLLFFVLVALLVGGMAWKFWPRAILTDEKAALPVMSAASVTKNANPASATSSQAVSTPKLPAAISASSSSTSNAANPALDRAVITAAGGSIEPVSVNYDNNQVNMDFGDVVFTPGLPVPLIMPTGQTGTMTASVGEGGTLQIDLDIHGNAPSGQSTMMHTVVFTDGKGGSVEVGAAGLNFKFAPKLVGK